MRKSASIPVLLLITLMPADYLSAAQAAEYQPELPLAVFVAAEPQTHQVAPLHFFSFKPKGESLRATARSIFPQIEEISNTKEKE